MTTKPIADPVLVVARALAAPTRLDILRAVAARERSVGDVALEVGVSQATASHHLAYLRAAGLLVSKREGRMTVFQMSSTEWFLASKTSKPLAVKTT